MLLKNMSNFQNIEDYLPIITSALIVDMVIILNMILGHINIKSLNSWYNKFGFLAVIADVLSIVIGIIISRFIYPYIWKEYSLINFIFLICIVQITHDLLFYLFFNNIPRNKSAILDVFKDYVSEVGSTILIADSLMMISTIIIASYISNMNTNNIIIILISSLYILPYLLYSIPT